MSCGIRPLFSAVVWLALAAFPSPSPARAQAAAVEDKAKNHRELPARPASIPQPGKLSPIQIRLLDAAPVIDGNLDDAAWQGAPLPLGDWLTYNPAYGETTAQKTTVWMAYDKSNLYLAFRCLDPEPDKIKTSIARRDTIWNDDWVGISLDALSSGQSSYDLFVNPNAFKATSSPPVREGKTPHPIGYGIARERLRPKVTWPKCASP